jgi:hypothetical protein
MRDEAVAGRVLDLVGVATTMDPGGEDLVAVAELAV